MKREGYRLRFVDGRDLVQVRMYQGLAEAWRGWRKNAFLGSRGGIAFVLLQLLGLAYHDHHALPAPTARFE